MTEIILETRVTPEMIRSLRNELGESLTEFGWTLKRAVNPKASRPYSRQYIERLEKGKDRITGKLAAAFFEIAGAMDDVPAGVNGAVSIRVLAQPDQIPDGTLIKRTMTAKRCARPGCAVVFVGYGKYHDPECAKAWRRERRKIQNRVNRS
jgi:hypothetical protein